MTRARELFSLARPNKMVISQFLLLIQILGLVSGFIPAFPNQRISNVLSHHIKINNLSSLRLSIEEQFSAAVRNTIPKNVLGTPLQSCCLEPRTGFYRDGFCRAGPRDTGRFVVQGKFSPAERHICAQVTEEFLQFTLSKGNDLVHPQPIFGFFGLRPGDRWCIW
jgi:uncharacterized protein (DUF2237 family)